MQSSQFPIDKFPGIEHDTSNQSEDDMVLELAASAGCKIIVTYNKDDFKGVEQFGIRVLTAQEFLREIGELP